MPSKEKAASIFPFFDFIVYVLVADIVRVAENNCESGILIVNVDSMTMDSSMYGLSTNVFVKRAAAITFVWIDKTKLKQTIIKNLIFFHGCPFLLIPRQECLHKYILYPLL